MQERPKVICLTPVKNEAWILERFLKLASLWADHIIIADQMSTDGSREIAKQFEKVILVDNNSEVFNEPERQKLLIAEARKIPGPKLLITLDADEALTPNYRYSEEWEKLFIAGPGTVFKFGMVHFQPDLKMMRIDRYIDGYWGYMDDGKEHGGQIIHSHRIPFPEGKPIVEIKEIKVIHFQFTDWNRMESKHRWYQCYERVNFPQKSAIALYRMYHQMYSFPKNEYVAIPQIWIDEYLKLGIDLRTVVHEKRLFWDEEILNLFDNYGTLLFRRESIWNVDWIALAEIFNRTSAKKYGDPRNIIDKVIQKYLKKTQPFKDKYIIRQMDKRLKQIMNY